MTTAPTTATTAIAANLSRLANSTFTTLSTTMLPTENLTTNVTISNSTTVSTPQPSTSTPLTSSTPATTTSMLVTKTSVIFTNVTAPTTKGHTMEGSFSGLVFLSLVLLVVAVAVIGKIIYSNRRRRSDLIGGTARWRLAASHQSGTGPQQTVASYTPMGGGRQGSERNGLDTPGPDRLDWERQFFDDTEATVPSRLQLDLSRT
ncbi:hypothetical protein KIN20_017182 [Parelaphostrongylus tenuis]|uniref:Uncharacterized protein n=1 Tax=Parelaphostrongylus tenuis TaxID=148309 RepID=A0AAD5QQH3_PARTN|nr:hypothetical protein KIN20_017182 [Parelaphostrongylus tenuis]